MNGSQFAKCTTLALAAVSLMGCGARENSSGDSSAGAKPIVASALTPAIEPALKAWQGGDRSVAVTEFVGADWAAQPLFASGSVLGLGEEQFKSLSTLDREVKSREMIAEIGSLKQLAAAVAQAGREAAAKKDIDQARKHFLSLKQCGDALDGPDSLALLKLVGQGIKRMADAELQKLER